MVRLLIAALLGVAACAGDHPAAGKWNCTNISDTKAESPWTLLLREDAGKLAGILTDGYAELPLSELKLDRGAFTFRFYVNSKPYAFDGKLDGSKIEGRYSGEEASGKLRCQKPAN